MKVIMMMTLMMMAAAGENLPAEAAALKAKRDAKVREIDSAYLAAMSKLRDKYLAAGDSKSAAAVGVVLGITEQKKDDPLKRMVGVWQRDSDNRLFNIQADGTGTFNGNQKITLTWDAEKNRILVISEQWANQFWFTNNPDVVNGSYDQNVRSVSYRIKRIK